MGEPEFRDFCKILNVTSDASEKTIRRVIPPKGVVFFSINRHKKHAFDFIQPPVGKVITWWTERTQSKPHPGDSNLSEGSVRCQLEDYAMAAKNFTLYGMNVFVRKGLDKEPKGYNTPDWNN
jgi:alpha-ketoglutarate-dependent taurine dioxygenase